MQKLFGVNLSGADFDNNSPATTVPGTFDKDYTYPLDLAEMQYYVKKGFTLFRLPIRWERIQRSLLADLNADDVTHIQTVLDNAKTAGAQVILELHNYGVYQTGATTDNPPKPITEQITVANVKPLVDVWTKMAKQFGKHPALFGYGIMNEPHDLPDGATGWAEICQPVADAIAAVDPNNWVLVPGYGWQSAPNWVANNPGFPIKGAKILYDAHCYFDGDASGQYWWGTADNSNGTGRLQPFIDWLNKNNVKGIVTEYGVPFGPGAQTPLKTEWYPVLEDFLTTIKNTDALIGGTAWAGGPWWGDYTLTVEPTTNYTVDRASMASYQKFPSSGVTTPSPTPTPTPSPTPTPQPPTEIPAIDVQTLNIVITDAEAILKWLRAKFNI